MRGGLCLFAVAASLLAAPATAAAQKDVFIDAFISFHSSLLGTYGDEGALIESEFARLTASLEVWERSATAAEADLKKRSATPGEFALHYVEQQQLEPALAAMNSAIAEQPNRGSLYLYQGQLLEALQRPAEAIRAFAKARQLAADDPLAAYFVASRSSGSTDLAPLVATLLAAVDRPRSFPQRPFADLTLLRDLSSKSPVFAPAAYVQAFAAFRDRRFREALNQFRESLARDPLLADPAARSVTRLAGVAALRANDGKEAIARLETAVTASPESSEARRALGIAYRAVRRLSDSITQFELAVRLRPEDERARIALGTTLAEAGRLEDAERELRNTIKALPASGAAHWELADLLDKQNRGAEAIQILESAAGLPVVAGRTHLLWRIAEMAHQYRRDSDHVISEASQMVRLVPNEWGGYKDLGLAYYRAGRDDEAAIELSMAALLGHEDGEMLGALGEIHLNAGRLDRAAATLFRAVALDPMLAQARYVLARTLQRLGRNDEAKEQLTAFSKLRTKARDVLREQFEKDNAMGAQTPQ